MNIFELLSIFDWVRPAKDYARMTKRFVQGKGDHYLFVKDGMFGQNLGRAEATLKAAGISYRRLSGSWYPFADGWMLEISYNDREKAMNVLRKHGVSFRE